MTAKAILEAKLALEDELIGPLSYVLSGYMEGWVKADGQMHLFDQVAYRGRIESVLIRHYARVISVLSGIKPTSETTIDQVALGPAHAERMTNRAHNQARHMVRGMERDLVTILAMMPAVPHEKRIGEIETKKDKLTVSIAGRFKETAKQAWNKLKARLRAIANVETQGVAEEYQIEWVKQQHANSRVYKQWHNSQDERVRGNPEGRYANSNFDHWVAEGIEVPVNEPFIVSGEELMFPGDGGRGASLGNIINCRCSAHYLIIGPNGERIDIPLKTPVIPAKRRWHRGDRLGVETPVRATEAITMTGRTRANIVLGDGRTFAVMQQVAPDTVVIRANGQDLARATFSNGVVTSMTTVQGAPHLDLEGIIRRSVEASHRLAQ